MAGALLAERDVPILVVTIPSLTARGAAGYTIERQTAEPFERWGIGSQGRNYGMLLLVSVGDRAARIELGADYAGRHDASAAQVMDNLILPEFTRRPTPSSGTWGEVEPEGVAGVEEVPFAVGPREEGAPRGVWGATGRW